MAQSSWPKVRKDDKKNNCKSGDLDLQSRKFKYKKI